MKIKMTKKQVLALQLMEEGKNIFLSGVAGTGKSFVINTFLERMKNKNKNVIVCAPTGVAALNVHGSTLHRTFKIPLEVTGPNTKIKQPKEAIIDADIIVIDEISMARLDVFEYCMKVLKRAEAIAYSEKYDVDIDPAYREEKQVIVVGDFKQLPPVIQDKERELLENYWKELGNIKGAYAFMGPSWTDRKFIPVILDEVVRQEDKDFVAALNAIRQQNADGLDWITEKCNPRKLEKAIYLTGTNKKVKAHNEKMLAQLEGASTTYYAEIDGKVSETDKPTDDELQLKVGARVMAIVNDGVMQYVNGSLGTIRELKENSVIVDFDNGSTGVEVEKNRWDVVDYEVSETSKGKKKFAQVELGHFSQIPLKVAYAITIHKSQGQTYDAVNLDPFSFASGQLYVALSRVKDVKNLHLNTPFKEAFMIMDQEVMDFYNLLQEEPLHPKTEGTNNYKSAKHWISLYLTNEEESVIKDYLEQYRRKGLKNGNCN